MRLIMTTKNIYYYSALAASEYGHHTAETLDGTQIIFTQSLKEHEGHKYEWNDKQVVGIFSDNEVKYISYTHAKGYKTFDELQSQARIDAFNEMTKEVLKNKENASHQISALRALYNTAIPIPSDKNNIKK